MSDSNTDAKKENASKKRKAGSGESVPRQPKSGAASAAAAASTEEEEPAPRSEKKQKSSYTLAPQTPARAEKEPLSDLDKIASKLGVGKFSVTRQVLGERDLLVAAFDGGDPWIRSQLMNLAVCYRGMYYKELDADCHAVWRIAKDPEVPEHGLCANLLVCNALCTCVEFQDHVRPLCDEQRFDRWMKYIKLCYDAHLLARDVEKQFTKQGIKNQVPTFPSWVDLIEHLIVSYCCGTSFLIDA